MNTELVRQDQAVVVQDESARFLPVMSIATAVKRHEDIVQAVATLMKPDVDFGVIPGTKKPTLYQPGADKLCNLFGLVPSFEIVKEESDWTGERHGGEAFFFYEVKCRLYRSGFLMGEGDGSANSWETKYRYRKTERECPRCSQPTIRKNDRDPNGGWYCWRAKGGCGGKFSEEDPEIAQQVVGYVPNPNIFDVVNTVRKIANKRAKIAATLNATSAHEFYTQDVEDLPSGALQNSETSREEQPAKTQPAPPPEARSTRQQRPATGQNEVPQPVLAMWKDMSGNREKIRETVYGLKQQLLEITDDVNVYYKVLGTGIKEIEGGTADPQECRIAVLNLYLTIERLRNAAPAAEEIAADEFDRHMQETSK